MSKSLNERVADGLQMIRAGREIIEEARENYAQAKEAFAADAVEEMERIFAEVDAENEALSARIQRA